jgi:hypothetical protein
VLVCEHKSGEQRAGEQESIGFFEIFFFFFLKNTYDRGARVCDRGTIGNDDLVIKGSIYSIRAR